MNEESNGTQIVKESGFVRENLNRNAKQLRQDRAESIYEELQVRFDRRVQDLELDLKRLRREQNAEFDFNPANTHSLVFDKVDAVQVQEKDEQTSMKIRETLIRLNDAKQRYNFLFGDKYDLEPINY